MNTLRAALVFATVAVLLFSTSDAIFQRLLGGRGYRNRSYGYGRELSAHKNIGGLRIGAGISLSGHGHRETEYGNYGPSGYGNGGYGHRNYAYGHGSYAHGHNTHGGHRNRGYGHNSHSGYRNNYNGGYGHGAY